MSSRDISRHAVSTAISSSASRIWRISLRWATENPRTTSWRRGPDLEQALGPQELERLTHRRLRDAELLRDRRLGEHGADRKLALEDRRADVVVGLVGQAATTRRAHVRAARPVRCTSTPSGDEAGVAAAACPSSRRDCATGREYPARAGNT